jgi:hypothetical protein
MVYVFPIASRVVVQSGFVSVSRPFGITSLHVLVPHNDGNEAY